MREIEATKQMRGPEAAAEKEKPKPKPKAECKKEGEDVKAVDAAESEDKKESVGGTKAEEGRVQYEDFVPIQQLGKGSFGVVYLTRYKPTEKLYAMKILPKQKVVSQNLLKYARAERNVLSYTHHPFIVGLDFAFQTSESLFLLMDFCPGYSGFGLS